MSEPLSTEEREAIRAREQAATPGPWTPSKKYPHICWQGIDGEGEPHILSASLSERPAEDIAFAAHARQDVPRLLAEVDRLRTELESNRQRWYHDDQGRTECVAGHDPETGLCAEGGGPVFSEVVYLTQLVEIWTGLTRSCENDVTQLRAEVERIKAVAYTQTSMLSEITSACMAAEVERDARLTASDVERFLKRERDEYETHGECWNTVDDALDAFRLHMVTGTPLTEPRPSGGPEAVDG